MKKSLLFWLLMGFCISSCSDQDSAIRNGIMRRETSKGNLIDKIEVQRRETIGTAITVFYHAFTNDHRIVSDSISFAKTGDGVLVETR